jgi:MoaA/NifB/PqqE/SkfB family radical SAM enzyme
MANISLTRRCRRHCSYCFAKHELSRDAETDMRPETFEAALEFLQRSGIPEARLLGGEPTEHPLFEDYIAMALERGFRVLVFSGGIIPRRVVAYMAKLSTAKVSMILNTANPNDSPESLVNRQLEICRTLGDKVMLGINIRSANENPAYALEWVKTYALARTVRVGIANPIWGATNDFFRLRGPRPIPVFEQLFAMGAEMGIDIGFDCGFTPCMFSQAFVSEHIDLFTQNPTQPDIQNASAKRLEHPEGTGDARKDDSAVTPADSVGAANADKKTLLNRMDPIGMRCGPVVDILPDGDCISCYALSRFLRLPLPSDGSHSELVSCFNRALSSALPLGIFRDCFLCPYREQGVCNGGCRARKALRLRPNPLITLGLEPKKEHSEHEQT